MGVDRTPTFLDRARKQAIGEGLEIEFIQSDMREFCRPEAFDTAINLFTSFGYFENPDDDRKVVGNVFRSLKPGGAFLIDMMGKEILARIFCERDWSEEGDLILLEERKVCRNWSWIENRWILLKDGKKHEFKFSHRVYSAFEITTLLNECGFSSVDIYGDLAGSPYDHTATRLVVTGHKSKE